ncbi:MAG: beta-lactamase family protein [Chloroflexi bacterium]|nr:beta-lactamase family protein [Chloroflexota bacterium]
MLAEPTLLEVIKPETVGLSAARLDRLSRRIQVRLMATNHIGQSPIGRTEMRGYRFGLGVQIVDDIGQTRSLQSVGSFGWNGAFSTSFWVDPVEDLVHVLLTLPPKCTVRRCGYGA